MRMENKLKNAMISWYPGHMTKAMRNMKTDIKLVDLVVEVVDCRAVISSRNPDIDKLCNNKPRIIVLNKSDLADERINKSIVEKLSVSDTKAILCDSRKTSDVKQIRQYIEKALSEKKERDLKRGIKNRALRIMVVGIPNVGKSTFINSLAKRSATKTGDKPGVTKGNQWINIGNGIELLDTPGVLWPKFEDEQVGINLALIGSINENIIDIVELSTYAIKFLISSYRGSLCARYDVEEKEDYYDVLKNIALNRNLIKSGSEPDIERASKLLLDDFRSGKITRFSLERYVEQ